jgi:phosphoribosylformimino-5-aminoimidazole carboxamide ribotide isomerase
MIILPAIDIKDGKCVRLIKGDFEKSTEYKKSPLDQSIEFSDLGFKNIHIIDLDGALEGRLINKNIIEKIIKKNNLKIQVGGGIRTLKNIEEWINIGVDKVIIGTAAVDNINFLQEACSLFKNRIALALDVRSKLIALSGWKKQTNISAIDFAHKIRNFGVSRIIYTDINKDGTKKGPNINDTVNFAKKINISTIVSGGIASISDIINIKKLNSLKIEGVIVGKAIYDKSINLKELSKLI